MSRAIFKWFYESDEWLSLKVTLIAERGNKCEMCGKFIKDKSDIIGHHEIELTEENIKDAKISLNPIYIKLVCPDCHNKKHRRFGYNKHNVYIVYGPPLSGKNTLVNQLSQYGDLILDLDKIYESISGLSRYNKPNNLRFNVFAIRDKIIDMVKVRYGQWCDAYIIGGYPNKYEREKLAAELRAEIIYCECTKEECYRRVKDSGRSSEWVSFIDKWFEQYIK